jgi:hypothetical protein
MNDLIWFSIVLALFGFNLGNVVVYWQINKSKQAKNIEFANVTILELRMNKAQMFQEYKETVIEHAEQIKTLMRSQKAEESEECQHSFGHYENDEFEHCIECGERGQLAVKERP